jgi:hypothetical protein
MEEFKMTATLKINEELNGIELYFTSKPVNEVLTNLKSNGFRWSGFKKCWYTKQTEKALKVANSLVNNIVETVSTPKAAKKEKKEKVSFNLWEATQWTEMEISQSQKDQENKLIAKELRAHVKKRFPQVKFSVTCKGWNSIYFNIVSSPFEKGSVYLNAIREYCKNLLNTYHHCYDPGDCYTDYAGSYNFYGHVEIHWDYTQTEATEEVKQDMADFDSQLETFNKAEEERKWAAHQEWMKQQAIKDAEYKKQQEEEKKQIKFIYDSVEVNAIEEDKQYFVAGAEFADLNKNNTLDQYKEEVEKGKFSLETVKITKEIHFDNQEALNTFSNMLLNDFDFLTGTGGTYTDDNRLNSMTDFYNMDEDDKNSVKWNLYGVAVYFNNKLQFVIDAQGYDYARYVGLTDNATIEGTYEYKQVLTEDELNELKYDAAVLEDISTSVIEELNIMDTWEKENWSEYKEAFKIKLSKYDFKLNKRIIQQLEIEELKLSMYKLLTEVDSIQEQFKDAAIQQGEKVTLFYISDWGSIVTSRVTFDSVENTKYAQYDNAVKLTFKPENKRNLHYNYFHSTLLVYKGFHSLPETVLNEIEESNGMRITRSKFHSCDDKQYDEILNYFAGQGLKPVVNTYKPTFN